MSLSDIAAVLVVGVGLLPASKLPKSLEQYRLTRGSLALAVLLYCLARVLWKLIWHVLLYPYYFSPLQHLPHAAQGELRERFLSEPDGGELEKWTNEIPNQGLIRYFGRFNKEKVLVTSPQGCEEVLQTHARHFPKHAITRKILKMWVGQGSLLGSLDGEGHKGLRKRILPAFYARHLRDLQPIFWTKACQMCQMLSEVLPANAAESEAPSTEVLMDDLIDRVALDVVGLAGHGVDFNAVCQPNGQVRDLYRRAFDLGKKEVQVVLSALLLPDIVFDNLPFKTYQDNRAGVAALREHCRQVIRLETPTKGTKQNASKDVVAVASHTGDFSEDELVDIAIDLLVAGHKTVSSALQLAFYTLARYPDVQERLRSEIRKQLPCPSTLDTETKDIDGNLPYLNAVTNELLRLYPPLQSMARTSIGTVSVCGEVLLGGSNVVVSQWAMNRSRSLWGNDAGEFKPERWFDESKSRPSPLTFSRGPRNCVGERFARAEIASIVAAVIGKFELRVEGEDAGIEPGITIHVKGGCRVGVRELGDW